jgi:hypothetical protein
MWERWIGDMRGLTKPVDESVDHDIRQKLVGIGLLREFEQIIAEIHLPSTTLRAWTEEYVIEFLNN